MKYRKKPVVIDAWQWDGKSLIDARDFSDKTGLPWFNIGARGGVTGLIIPTLEGEMIAQQGDWIIRGIEGELYPCKPDIFEATYEAVA
jgi:hypothetical protein